MNKIFTLMPAQLNLNGEQGNVLVMKRRLEWLGQEVTVFEADSPLELIDLLGNRNGTFEKSFVFIGHGSLETLNYLATQYADLRSLFDLLLDKQIPTLIVGTVYELLFESTKLAAFKSQFTLTNFPNSNFEILGYEASASDLSAVTRIEPAIVLTTMHGPILAKNPALADWFLLKMGTKVTKNINFKKVEEIILKVWELESPR